MTIGSRMFGAFLAAIFATAALAQQEPLRIGFLTVRTGPLAAGGRQMEEGINLFLKERNNTLAGRKVQIFFADTAGRPARDYPPLRYAEP
jgi:branched-chain amino acid transport system substrate-binding protein